jgi:hypothetical protein
MEVFEGKMDFKRKHCYDYLFLLIFGIPIEARREQIIHFHDANMAIVARKNNYLRILV